jgi:uncharacterized protein (DUF2062 family)
MGFFQKRIAGPILAQLKQGVTPAKIAQSIAWGATIAVFPLLGTTTLLCFIAGIFLKLNQPMIQLVNYLCYPLQILLIPVFARLGEWVWRSEHVPFSPLAMKDEFMKGPKIFLEQYGKLGLEAVTAWSICAPILITAIYFASFKLLALIQSKQTHKRMQTQT